jgi:hypothetical protein
VQNTPNSRRPRQPDSDTPAADLALTSTAAAWAVRLLMLLALLCTLPHLAACGGGGDSDDGLVPTPGVDCKAHPELCK